MTNKARDPSARSTSRLASPRWLLAAAIALAVWAVALGLWWSQLHRAPTVAPLTPAVGPTSVAVSKADVTLTPTPEATPVTVPVVRSAGELVRKEHWAALARSFDENRALADIAELTSAKYAGRAVGSPGGWLAAEWIAARFAEYGLQPAGDNGTYFQEFPVPYAELTAMPSFQLVDEAGQTLQEYRFRHDYTIWLGGYADGGQAEGPVLWVSDGAHNDYDGLNAEGAIVLCRFTSRHDVLRQALEHGAKAVLLARLEPVNFMMRSQAREDALLPQGVPALLVSSQIVADLLASSDMTLDDLTIQYKSRPLNARVRLDVPLQYQEQATGRNVLGVLPGSASDGADQVVIIGGHYDHLGADPDGTAWVGANDNASGVSTVLEIARQWQEQGYVPKRTVLFAAWDGEEIGLFGSRYYVEHPRYPLRDTVGMLQLDMVGAGISELCIDAGGLVANQSMASAGQLGIPVQAQSLGRSDHAPFIGAGVPATLYIWWDGVTPGVIYHVPEDDVNNIEPAKLKAAGELADLLVLNLSWEQEELEDLAAQREQAIAARDVATMLRTVDPHDKSLLRQEEAWLNAVTARQPAEFTVTVGSAIAAADIATATTTIRYRWQSEDTQAVASFPARWVRRDLDWYYGGPAWDEVTAQHIRVQHLQEPDLAWTLAEAADTLYEFLTDEAGLDMPDTVTVRLYDSDPLLHALHSPPPGYDEAHGWRLDESIVLSQAADFTTTLLEFTLQCTGWPTQTASWLAQGVSDYWRGSDSELAREIETQYLPLLLQADADNALWSVEEMPNRWEVDRKDLELWSAQAWAMTHSLLQADGWAALRQPSTVDVAAWRTALLDPWHSAAQGINDTLEERSKAVLAGDKAAFLTTVDVADQGLYQEESHWFDNLQSHPADGFAYKSHLLSLDGDYATVQLNVNYRLAKPGSIWKRIDYQARFVQRDGRCLYADVDFAEERSKHFLLKYITEKQGEQAHELLAHAERAYAQVTSDLGFRSSPPIEIKLYDQRDLFCASIFLSMSPTRGWTESGESIKLNTVGWDEASLADAGRVIAHQLTHQALFAKGVQHGGVREGTAHYEAGVYDAQWLAMQMRKWQQKAYDLVRSKRPINLATLTDWREWQESDPELLSAIGWDTVNYFRQRYGRETFLQWLNLLGTDIPFEEAFAKATGMAFADFDADWRESVLRGHIDPQYIEMALAFDAERALEHVQTLAQPAWAGREAGTAGNEAAAQYIAESFAEYGLQPAGDNGTYFQHFAMSQTALITTPVLALFGADGSLVQSLRYDVDFRELIGGCAGDGRAESAVIYVKDSRLDDLQLGGRVLLTHAGSDPWQDAQNAAQRGAGALLLTTNKWPSDMAVKTHDLRPLGAQTIPVFELTGEASDALFELAGYTPWQLAKAPPALPLPVSALVDVQLAMTPTVLTANVLGVLTGSDPDLANEVVIVGAHLDHVGSLPDGTIYPGANNDASGVAVLLEIARLWHEKGYRPRRTVLFAAWNATEMGLLGSNHYVTHPVYPLEKTLAMIQLDMVGQGRGFYIDISADERQEARILAHLDNAARQVEGRVTFVKYEGDSDHDSFHRQGVPAARLAWQEAEYLHVPEDTADTIAVGKLHATGRVTALALMTMADE